IFQAVHIAAWPSGPVGFPPFQISRHVMIGDRINGLLAEIADEESPHESSRSPAEVGAPLASCRLLLDVRNELFGHARESDLHRLQAALGAIEGSMVEPAGLLAGLSF